jgi:hypothetical protein
MIVTGIHHFIRDDELSARCIPLFAPDWLQACLLSLKLYRTPDESLSRLCMVALPASSPAASASAHQAG